ncbi:hypothetical protein KAR91_51635 [Candidatus Pacearchaeota archaeon]|nr:hypothetical protein [Candidatus Pacearchaeota archaeon]
MVKGKEALVAVLVVGVFLFMSYVSAGQIMALQGNVINSSGGDLISGDLVVEIWDSLVGGNMVYNSTDNYVGNITYGRYDILLGEYTSLSLDYGRNYYMAVAIDSEPLSFHGQSRRLFQPNVGTINSSFLNLTTVEATGNITSGGWFNGLFNWVIAAASRVYFSFDGNVLTFNETKLNETIDSKFSGGGFGSIAGFSALTYSGSITNGSLVGYAAANAICSSDFSGSHFCLESEVMKDNVVDSGRSGQYWVAKGAPGYTANANDCEGWTKTSGELGPFWDFDENAGVGAGKLTTCLSTLKLACCG